MEDYTVIIIILVFVAFITLIIMIRNRNKRIEELENSLANVRAKSEADKKELKNEIVITRQTAEERVAKTIKEKNETQNVAEKQIKEAKEKAEFHIQEYYKVLRAYMIARKKSEIEVIEEIEQALSIDYEELGIKNIKTTDYVASVMADFYTSQIKNSAEHLRWIGQYARAEKIDEIRKEAANIICRAKINQYAYEIIIKELSEKYSDDTIAKVIEKNSISLSEIEQEFSAKEGLHNNANISKLRARYNELGKLFNEEQEFYNEAKISKLKTRCDELEYLFKAEKNKNRELNNYNLKLLSEIKESKQFTDKRWTLLKESVEDYQREFKSNLTAIPYMSRIIADIMTVDIDRLAWSLSWGNNKERKKKVESLVALKKEKAEEIERIKGAEYQLAYLLELYPTLQNVIDAEFSELEITYDEITDYDPVIRYIEMEEWKKLSETERNQLALDRYIESRKKSKWQIGRDYELYCGYCYEQKGYKVDYYGSYNGLEDLGRDLIITKNGEIQIVQCKYWSASKLIHENHIMQLYGSVIEYNLEHNKEASSVLITNIELSEKAKEFAHVLNIDYIENFAVGDFPRIKCNIGVDENGKQTKVYHLPFDQQYDTTKIDRDGEFMAMTVKEAENAGFRRAYRWHGPAN